MRAMTARNESSEDVLIVGAGVIGLACAWRAARAGARVRVLERDRPAAAATGVAAGMLAPVGEASWGEEALLSLNLDSLRRWPDFARELEADASDDVGYAEIGAMHVALDRDEAEALRRRHELHRRFGLESEWLRGSECRRVEPGLATAVRNGVHARHEAAVDPRRLAGALLAALERRGARVDSGAEVIAAERDSGSWRLTTAGGRQVSAPTVVLAAGAWSAADWLPAQARLPVRPVKGEILTLRGAPNEPVCQGIVAGERVYVIPREDGRLIVGSTVEEAGFDTTVTAGGVHELLREAYRLLPEIAQLELAEASAGLRPGTPDNAPLIGSAADGLIVATGHYRNGVLQAPVTAESVVALLEGDQPPHDLAPFSPLRFASEQAVAEVVR
jgi:glycine oxidase